MRVICLYIRRETTRLTAIRAVDTAEIYGIGMPELVDGVNNILNSMRLSVSVGAPSCYSLTQKLQAKGISNDLKKSTDLRATSIAITRDLKTAGR